MAREKAGLSIGGFSIGLCIVMFYPLTRLLGRRRFEGLEHIPESGPVPVVPMAHWGTHRVYDDPLRPGVRPGQPGKRPS